MKKMALVLLVLFMVGCEADQEGSPTDIPDDMIIRYNGTDIEVYERPSSCVYVYRGYGIAAVPKGNGGC